MSKIHKELTSGEGAQWLMRTEGGDVYGPVDLETLQRWATQGRIEPESEISQDEEKWIAAEALAALHMDWVAEMADGTEYGPFNINLAPDLIKNGVLPADATLKHRETGEEQSIQQLSDDQQTALPLGDLMADAPKPKPKRRAPKEKAKASTRKTKPEVPETMVAPEEPEKPAAPEAVEAPEEPAPKPPASEEVPPAEDLPNAPPPQPPAEEPSDTPGEDSTPPVTESNDVVSERLELLQKSASQARAQLTSVRKDLTEQRAAATAMQDELRKLQEDLQAAETEKQTSERLLLEQQDELAQSRAETENLHAQLQQLQDHYDRLQIESQNQFEALDKLRAEAMENEQEYKRNISRETDRSMAKTSLMAQAIRLIAQDDDVEHGRLPKELLAGDPNQLQELQNRLNQLQQQVELERQHADQLQAQMTRSGNRGFRSVFTAVLVLLVLGLAFALAYALGTRRQPDDLTHTTPRDTDTEASVIQPEQQALAGLMVTNRGRSSQPPSFDDTGALDQGLDLAPEEEAIANAVSTQAPANWPELSLQRATVTRGDASCRIVFSYGVFSSATKLANDAARDLHKIADHLRGHSSEFTLLVEGHTDATPISSRGAKYVDNYALGMARAERVREFLETECDIPAGFIRTASAGEADPPYSNDTAESRRKNRTVVLQLTAR